MKQVTKTENMHPVLDILVVRQMKLVKESKINYQAKAS